MKKCFMVVIIVCMAWLTACGVQNNVSVETETSSVLDMELTSERLNAGAEFSTADADIETSTETVSMQKNSYDAEDWNAAYIEYLKTLTEESDHISSLENAEYAFVTMPGLKYPILVLFGGWRDFYFYTFENGSVTTAKKKLDDVEYDLIEGWVDMPVYYLEGSLYFFGGNGAPATIFTNEVSVKDGVLKSDRVASKQCTSAFGDRDYYYGRGEDEITENEYNAIVDGIKTKAKTVEFFSLKELKR